MAERTSRVDQPVAGRHRRAVVEQRRVADHHRARRRRRARRPRTSPWGGRPSSRAISTRSSGDRRIAVDQDVDGGLNRATAPATQAEQHEDHGHRQQQRGGPLEHRRAGRVEQVDRLDLGRVDAPDDRLGPLAHRACGRSVASTASATSSSAAASSMAAPARPASSVVAATARSIDGVVDQLVGQHGGLEVVDELVEQLGAHVGQHAPTELGHLAGDGEVGEHADVGDVALRRSARP